MSDHSLKGATRHLPHENSVYPVMVAMRRSLTVLATIAVLVTLYFAKDLILPILLGFLIALTLSPLSRFFYKLGIPHTVSAVLLILVTATTIAGAVVFSAGTVNGWVASAPDMGVQLKQKLSGISDTLEDVREASEEVEAIAVADTPSPVQEVVIKQPSLLDSAVSTATSLATTVAISLMLATFLLASGDMFTSNSFSHSNPCQVKNGR